MAYNLELLKTTALLPPNSFWMAYFSPQGMVAFIKRTASMTYPAVEKAKYSIPDFPKTPLIGIAFTAVPNEFQTCLAVPAEVLKVSGQYIGKIRLLLAK